jgi:DNA-binding protein HU-beta
MNKKQLIDRVSISTGHSKEDVREIFETIIHEIQQELVDCGKVSLTDFGVFSLDFSGSGEGLNPKTGERFHIYRAKPVFRVGKGLKESVSEAMAQKNALSIAKARTPS